MFILLTTLLNHEYAIRHVIFYHEWICSRLPIVLKTQWICSRERTRAGNINAVSSTQTVTMSLVPIFIKPIAICRPVRLKSVQFRCFIPWILLKSRKILNWVGRLLNTPIWEHLEKATQSLGDFFLQVIECFNLLRCFMIV